MKKGTIFFIILLISFSSIGYSWPWSDNGPEGKIYLKYDNNGKPEYRMDFENGFISIGSVVREVLWTVNLLKAPYEYDRNTKTGKLKIVQLENGNVPRMETHFEFRIANDILILTTHEIYGMRHQVWHNYIDKFGGTYIELK